MATIASGAPTRIRADERPLRGWPLWTRWTVVVTAGEVLGFVIPATVGATSVGWDPMAVAPALVIAGAAEGAILGWSQALVLDRALPDLRGEQWMFLTAAGAASAYLLAFVPTFLSLDSAMAAGIGIVLVTPLILLTIGGAQWLELRRQVRSAGHWIAWTAAAWLVALGAFFLIATPLWHEGQPTGEAVAVGVLAGVVMAMIQAAVTGWGLTTLLARTSQ